MRSGGLAPHVQREERCAAHAMGVSSATRLAGHVGILGRTSSRYSLTLILRRRHVSITELIAAIRGPASSLPICSQFLRPSATGRIAFSHQLLSISTSPWFTYTSILDHCAMA